MKRLLLATTAALALAACADANPVATTRTPPDPSRLIIYGPVQTIFTSQTPDQVLDASPGWEVSTNAPPEIFPYAAGHSWSNAQDQLPVP